MTITQTKDIDINAALVEVFGAHLLYVRPDGKPVLSLSASQNEIIYHRQTVIEESDKTYPIQLELWDNWFPFAYIAFQRLNSRLNSFSGVKSFATIGCGPGADAIGAFHAFKELDTLVITDIEEDVVSIAERNVRKYKGDIELAALVGSLCQPLKEKGIKVDVIYENLPNIPVERDIKDIVKGHRRSSRYKAGSFWVCDKQAKTYLLESHLAFLVEAKESLNPSGSAICSIGGRVPYGHLQRLVEVGGYRFEELVAGFKVQTEPEEVLPAYAEAETGRVAFDFYRYDEAAEFLRNAGMKKPFIELPGNELKNMLTQFRISAKEAEALYQRNTRYKIGHTLHMVRAIKTF